jgi:Type III secretion system regulator (LcrR)
METSSRLIPLVDDLTHILIEAGKNKLQLMQPYKGYFITASAMPVHPFNPDWYIGGSVLEPGHSSSIVEITRFQLQQFTASIKELAEWYGLEVARIVVDECLAQRRN